MTEQGRLKKLLRGIKGIPSSIKEAVLGYQRSYRVGVEKYGVWWKIFHWSIWLFVTVFLATAVIAFVFFLPKLQMIQYI